MVMWPLWHVFGYSVDHDWTRSQAIPGFLPRPRDKIWERGYSFSGRRSFSGCDNRDYDRNGSVDIQVLRNVLPEKSASRFHSVALQENSDVEIPCAVHWFVIYITTFISRTILALATYYIMQLKDGMGYKFR